MLERQAKLGASYRVWDRDGRLLNTLNHSEGIRSAIEQENGKIISWEKNNMPKLCDSDGHPLSVHSFDDGFAPFAAFMPETFGKATVLPNSALYDTNRNVKLHHFNFNTFHNNISSSSCWHFITNGNVIDICL